MAENQARERERITFEIDGETAASLRAIARSEHRTVSAQLRVIVEDAIADIQAPGA